MVSVGPKAFLALLAVLLVPPGLGAAEDFAATAETLAIDGPEPPAPPAVVTRDTRGGVTLRATRLVEPIVLDGRLAEHVYQEVPSITGFVQQEPLEGEPATEQTEVWIFHDETNIYVAARCWDSRPDQMIANELRRDSYNIDNNENFAVIFDTFYDRRNGFLFHTNPLGAIFDGQVTDESNLNSDWNTVWHVKTGLWSNGWVVEMAIPYKSLRYQGEINEIWGINFRRIVAWKNEWSYLTPVPAAYGWQGIQKLSTAATLVGHQPPRQALNLELKPYATGGLRTDLAADQPYSNDLNGDVGFDVKYGLTRGLTADFTYNTDFAQVEDDEQQVNLTRFGLFFPEKRDFFLEGKDVFGFAGVSTSRGRDNTPIMFFSRQIGLADDMVVPINAGGRVTGRAGDYTLGALAIQTGGVEDRGIPATDFGVFRLKRDVFRRSNIGVIGTYRSPATDAEGANKLVGFDGNFSFYENVDITTYYARTATPGLTGRDSSYRGRFQYGGDRYGLELEHLVVQENFNPGIGFVRREDLAQSLGKVRFSPRPESIEAIRKFTFETGVDYIENGAGLPESRQAEFQFRTELEMGDQIDFAYRRNYELLPEPFDITDDVVIPAGGYDFQRISGQYRFGTQRTISGRVRAETGSFYNGNLTEFLVQGRAEITPRFSIEPRVAVNWADLEEGSFTTKLFRARFNYMFSARMFLGALLQYNSEAHLTTTNVRFRWEYEPGSDVFVVYSDGRDTLASGFPALQDRSLVVKFTRLIRF